MISIRISWIRSSRPRKIGEYLFLFAVFDTVYMLVVIGWLVRWFWRNAFLLVLTPPPFSIELFLGTLIEGTRL